MYDLRHLYTYFYDRTRMDYTYTDRVIVRLPDGNYYGGEIGHTPRADAEAGTYHVLVNLRRNNSTGDKKYIDIYYIDIALWQEEKFDEIF